MTQEQPQPVQQPLFEITPLVTILPSIDSNGNQSGTTIVPNIGVPNSIDNPEPRGEYWDTKPKFKIPFLEKVKRQILPQVQDSDIADWQEYQQPKGQPYYNHQDHLERSIANQPQHLRWFNKHKNINKPQ